MEDWIEEEVKKFEAWRCSDRWSHASFDFKHYVRDLLNRCVTKIEEQNENSRKENH